MAKKQKKVKETANPHVPTIDFQGVYTVAEAALVLRSSGKSIRKKIRDGRIPGNPNIRPMVVTGWQLKKYLDTRETLRD